MDCSQKRYTTHELSPQELRSVQLIQLELLLEVDRICKKCGIKYNIIAGTLLGAVRHGGYIPWDDDADVALLRPEYEKFRIACETELDNSRFYFQDHRNTKGYRWGYGKLRRKGTEFVRKNQEHMPYDQGIFIDIFPLDNVPENYIVRCFHNFHCFLIRKTLWSAVGRIGDKNAFMRLVYSLLYKIPDYKVFKHYHRFMTKYNKVQTKWVRILTFPTPNRKFGYLRKWYEESADIKFENYYFPGIKEYDEYLTFKFGNYMELPPVNMRKTHPVTELKLIKNDLMKDMG